MSEKIKQADLEKIKDISYKLVAYNSKELKPSIFSTNKTELPNYGVVRNKIVSLEEAVKKSGLKSGMTISFHHHFRSGDKTIQLVMEVIDKLKIKDITIASSSFTDAHNFLIDYIKKGVVTGLQTSGCRDELGKFVSSGEFKNTMIIRSHGGRARAIESGDLKIDLAFIAASSSDEMGNCNGVIGQSACGSLGYGMVDAQYAAKTIIITDHLVDYPNKVISISQSLVDYVVVVDQIGDPNKIVSKEIRLTSAPKEEIIADFISKVIVNTELFKEGFSIQMGTGGASLSAIKTLTEHMVEKNIKSSFCLGGITGHQVNWLETGLTTALFDTQCFDISAVNSIAKNKNHIEISASMYANAQNKSPFVNKLDYVILSALEVDLNFNVNVITGSDGVIRGAQGGHPDTAQGAKITIVALPLIRGRMSCVVENVNSIVTPGNTVDVIVTDYGIAVNPNRQDIIESLQKANVKINTLQEMMEFAYSIVGKPKPIEYDYSKPVAVVEYRDGSIIDIIYKVKEID
ncbi:citrate lyase subunit alpha / citrate CoA-transferase [Spiroplasma helicoides]|uniref:Citrate lyase alpha chain n=1 Tax=Spiroplasma helicoides TaxID=216938 RepID=A0A1B3SM47_9MOLU|nr:citrate lyase subunit alpha [Spiroplasma helicoides]AOG60987.1 citrate lyase subunit alpha / citrate CoA-transferase [Spiroplasma helicoides]